VIIDFTVTNFRSFKAAQSLSFIASNYDKSLPDNFVDPGLPGELADVRLLKGVAIYGANAAGKSNVLLAFNFLWHLIEGSATSLNEGDPINVEPFSLDPATPNEPTEFVLRFVLDKVRYHFALVLNSKRILFESLSSFPKGREQGWYSRTWDDKKRTYDWEPARPAEYKRALHRVESTRQNALYLSTAVNLADEQLRPLYLWFKNYWKMLRLESPSSALSNRYTAKKMLGSASSKKTLTSLLRHADIGVLSASISEIEPVRQKFPDDFPEEFAKEYMTQKRLKISLGHRGTKGREYPLDWRQQSFGTRKFFALVGPWLDIIESGQFAAIDELDSSMHPSMVAELLKLVFSKKNEKAQILFSTHNPLLLDLTLIRRDQVWFADKDEEGATHLYALNDYKPRKKESLVRGYMAGRYGAVPFIPDGLLGPDEADGSHAE